MEATSLDTSNVGERLPVEQNPTAPASSLKSFSSLRADWEVADWT
jgi:hypothetical protein